MPSGDGGAREAAAAALARVAARGMRMLGFAAAGARMAICIPVCGCIVRMLAGSADDLPSGDSAVGGGWGVGAVAARATYIGALAFDDPLRPDARDAVAACARAGIRVVMVTGDHAAAAAAVAGAVGILPAARGGYGSGGGAVFDCSVAAAGEAASRAGSAAVFARAAPADKLAVLGALQVRGCVCMRACVCVHVFVCVCAPRGAAHDAPFPCRPLGTACW